MAKRPDLRKYNEEHPGEFVCPSKCGYSTDRVSSLSGHVRTCKKALESILSTAQAPDSRMSKRPRSEETTLLLAFPITQRELANYKAGVRVRVRG